MTTEIPKTYDFKSTEAQLYQWWEQNGWFKPSNEPQKPDFDPARTPFVISIPPPNVTGELHLGHAMFVAVEDLMIRYHRMKGDPTLWVPGSDHAGIATQLQVEKELLRAEEVTREELGREKFVERCWEWKRKYGNIIYDQLRRLGASCDWSRERFTLDNGLSRAVREAFVHLYEKGLIYRGPRLINWSPGLKTAVSDLEVEYNEEEVTLYYFKYMLKDSTGYIPVATVRPETILGDTAVAVHPDDARYSHLIGRTALVPMLGREIPVIADAHVNREFGTGAVKITPGHDPADYEIAQRAGLPIINLFNKDATLNENAGPYAGQDRFDCRRNLWADMERAGLTIKTDKYVTQIPRSQRGGEIVEPMVSTQWFVKIKPLAEAAMAAVKAGVGAERRRIRIVPERFGKVYFNWLENIKDWCISRQLWWGHRIPVWYCPDGHMTVARADPTECTTCGAKGIEQDPDVLDTWFSSGLWPFSTLGWPDETSDLKYFYPTSVMETGYDILFFWVARMIMMGLEFTGEAPFHTVYLHGLVRDGEGRKMSKTLGNVIDPREVMDDYGTDALRFTLLTAGTPGNDLNLSLQRVEANRNFANKIWNITRFVATNLPENYRRSDPQPTTLADRWIISQLNRVIADSTRLIDKYEFGQAGNMIYEFLWSDFADVYVEEVKPILKGSDDNAKARTRDILVYVLDGALRLLHPYVPFITEAVWQRLPHLPTDPPALIVASWPVSGLVDEDALGKFDHQIALVRGTRNTLAEHKILPREQPIIYIVDSQRTVWLEPQRDSLSALTRVDSQNLHVLPANPPIEITANAHSFVVNGSAVYVMPPNRMADKVVEREKLNTELAELDRQIAKSESLLASDFAHKAPAAVVDKERAKLAALKESRAKVEEQLNAI